MSNNDHHAHDLRELRQPAEIEPLGYNKLDKPSLNFLGPFLGDFMNLSQEEFLKCWGHGLSRIQ